jgi:hypothetical protein
VWACINKTPFSAERTWVRDKSGAETWLVAVKGTFDIAADGSTSLSERQEAVCRVPEFSGPPGESSMLHDADLVHTKLTTDVYLNGHAYAPGGKATDTVDAGLKVGTLAKMLRVHGDRWWRDGPQGLRISPPDTFMRMPITYERAFGGRERVSDGTGGGRFEPCNPVGTGFAVKSEDLDGQPLPNVEWPDAPITVSTPRRPPAGFGAISRHWSPRVEMAGTYDEAWEKTRQPLLPEDFDDRFYQCAPADQQTPRFLSGGESVVLRNLTPDGRLTFKLPRVALGFQTRFTDGELVHHRAVLHTVVIEPDQPRVILVWHTHLPCHHKVIQLASTRIIQKKFI